MQCLGFRLDVIWRIGNLESTEISMKVYEFVVLLTERLVRACISPKDR